MAGDSESFLAYQIAMSGDRMIIGSTKFPWLSPTMGWAHIFERDPTTRLWSWMTTLSSSQMNDEYAADVAIASDIATVGAPNDDTLPSGPGAAYLYEFDSMSQQWTQSHKFTESNNGNLGFSVAIKPGQWVVGTQPPVSLSHWGNAAVLEPGVMGGWSKAHQLEPIDTSRFVWFGTEMITAPTQVIGGESRCDVNTSVGTVVRAGCVLVFE